MKAVSVKKLLAKMLSLSEATPTLASGWTLYSATAPCVVYKFGRIGVLHIEVKPTSSFTMDSTERNVATIPEGYRPNTSIGVVTLHQGSGTSFFMSRIKNNGQVLVSRLRDMANANGNYTTATTTNWFPIHVIYIVGGYCIAVFSRLSAIFKKIGGGVDEGGKNKSTDCEDPRQAHDRNSDRDVRPRSHYIYRGHDRLNGNDKIHIDRKNRIYSDRVSCFIRKFERCWISAIYERLYGIRSNYQRTKRSVQRYILGVLDSDLQKIITISERRWAA